MDDRGHLVDMGEVDVATREEMFANGYEPVPKHLKVQAELELMGNKETFISMEATGSMSKHARYLRKKKQKQQKASRRKNRCCG